jgi:hypothetical protein
MPREYRLFNPPEEPPPGDEQFETWDDVADRQREEIIRALTEIRAHLPISDGTPRVQIAIVFLLALILWRLW